MTPEAIAYLRKVASERGYSADDLLRVINYESGGRPDVWGGKGGKYFGLFQAGGPEREKYHIDTKNPTAENQINGMVDFLHDRGFRPGMGLLDLYSTVNAGSPGHYNASDGNGTVAQHAARIMGQPLPAAAPGAPATPAAPAAQQPEEALSGLLSPRRAQPARPAQISAQEDDGFLRQAMAFHAANHAASLKGLL